MVRQASAATANCTNPQILGIFAAHLHLSSITLETPGNSCRIRTGRISHTWSGAGGVSWNGSLEAGLASLFWVTHIRMRPSCCPHTWPHIQGHSQTLQPQTSVLLRFSGFSFPFWGVLEASDSGSLRNTKFRPEAMGFLKLQFIWARGEHFPPETAAGRI